MKRKLRKVIQKPEQNYCFKERFINNIKTIVLRLYTEERFINNIKTIISRLYTEERFINNIKTILLRLYTEERFKNQNRTVLFGKNSSPEYLSKKTISGMWTLCQTKCEQKLNLMMCQMRYQFYNTKAIFTLGYLQLPHVPHEQHDKGWFI